ncbi:hypothetical protein VTN00DRAFT_7335 [Thermoascus crustaceus]|uniref:uncharacterized protein n=1 Tax=Thermoascus crustaceus TaxID=5088 RepID=UPI003742164D
MSASNTPYVSNGKVLQSPPFSTRIIRFFENVYLFLGLYFVSLLSLDPYTAAQNSKFNISRSKNAHDTRPRWGGSSYNSGGGGPGGGPSGSGRGQKRIGRVDDIRGPECGSCR